VDGISLKMYKNLYFELVCTIWQTWEAIHFVIRKNKISSLHCEEMNGIMWP